MPFGISRLIRFVFPFELKEGTFGSVADGVTERNWRIVSAHRASILTTEARHFVRREQAQQRSLKDAHQQQHEGRHGQRPVGQYQGNRQRLLLQVKHPKDGGPAEG